MLDIRRRYRNWIRLRHIGTGETIDIQVKRPRDRTHDIVIGFHDPGRYFKIVRFDEQPGYTEGERNA